MTAERQGPRRSLIVEDEERRAVERKFRYLLRDLHEQLLHRDEEIERLIGLLGASRESTDTDFAAELRPLYTRQAFIEATLQERTAWARRLAEEAEQRGAVIEELQRALDERTAWAERMIKEAEQRGAVIEELQRALDERTAWAERMIKEAEQRGAVIEELQRALDEREVRQAALEERAARAERILTEMRGTLAWRLTQAAARVYRLGWPGQ
jgi:hypothetical protein